MTFREPKHFVVVDPRTADGDAFEVAERGVQQIKGIINIALDSIEPARLMARNSELERQCLAGNDLDAVGWPETAEGRRWTKLEEDLQAAAKACDILARVAAFDPRKVR